MIADATPISTILHGKADEGRNLQPYHSSGQIQVSNPRVHGSQSPASNLTYTYLLPS